MTVNPIRIVKDSLPEYKKELLERSDKLTAELAAIDKEVATVDRLLAAVEGP